MRCSRWLQAVLCSCPHDTNWSLIVTDPEARSQVKFTAIWLPGPRSLDLWFLQHKPGENAILALHFPGGDWQLLGSSQSFAQVSAVLPGKGGYCHSHAPQVGVEGRASCGKKLVVSLALLFIKGLHTGGCNVRHLPAESSGYLRVFSWGK